MLYRQLGRTGLKVSQLGFGAMRLPMVGKGEEARVDREKAIPMIHRAFEAGVNYIDSAVGYCNSDSQRAVGDALKGWRDKIVVSTKNHYYGEDEKDWWKNLEDSLERLDVDCIDIYNHHGIRWERYEKDVQPRVGKWMRKAKDQGLIKHICASTHDNAEGLIRVLDADYIDVVTLQYNMLDRRLEDAIEHAHDKNIGVVVMGPVAGGRLGGPSDVLSGLIEGIERVPELALRFVLANPNVSVALSGMSTMQHVEENIEIASDPVSLTEEHKDAIEKHLLRLKELEALYCTACGYCMPCPEKVDIPGVFEKFNRGRVYGLWDSAKAAYAQMGKIAWDKGLPADACIECHECEEKCPQDIPICEQLRDAHEALTSKN